MRKIIGILLMLLSAIVGYLLLITYIGIFKDQYESYAFLFATLLISGLNYLIFKVGLNLFNLKRKFDKNKMNKEIDTIGN